ncbi:MAG: formyltransferase [Burkholderiales bacterium]|nr:formyltransferase [Burkholderiales bacterium]
MTSAVVFAYHDVGVRCLALLLEAGVAVPLVVTHRDDPCERVWFASVAQLCARRGLEAIAPEDPNRGEVPERLQRLRPDFLFSFYYRRMLAPQILSMARRGAYNMHGSLLPRYRGRAPVNWAVLHGETETGATLHEMVARPDAGRIVEQQRVPIGPDDTAGDVLHRVAQASEAVLRRALPRLIDGTAELREQDLARGSYFGGRRPQDGRIDWRAPARAVHDLVRAVAPPYPGAFSVLPAGALRVLRTRVEPGRAARAGGPGLYFEGGALFADCGDGGVLHLLEYETPGFSLEALLPAGGKLPAPA